MKAYASPELRFDAGRPSLDLIATVGARLSPAPVERLLNAERLAAWLVTEGLIPNSHAQVVDAAWLPPFTEARELLHRLVHATLDEHPLDSSDLATLNRLAAVAPPIPRIVCRDDGALHRGFQPPITAPSVLSLVARDAIDLLTGDQRALLRMCAGETCDLVYLDNSRGHRRRWCSTTVCGNRERVTQYRKRQRHEP